MHNAKSQGEGAIDQVDCTYSHGEATTCSIKGEISFETVNKLRKWFKDEKLDEIDKDIIFDLRAVDYMDSDGLKFLFQGVKLQEKRKKKMTLVIEEASYLRRLFDLTGFGTLNGVVITSSSEV